MMTVTTTAAAAPQPLPGQPKNGRNETNRNEKTTIVAPWQSRSEAFQKLVVREYINNYSNNDKDAEEKTDSYRTEHSARAIKMQ